MRNIDTRCCGTGTCMINLEGVCWCGQRWDGEKMCAPGTLESQGDAAKGGSAPHQPTSADLGKAAEPDQH